ncbi:MAG: hypothetical protein JXA69_17110 [Phycisphaerae bacterium]|nr:hypothetical protein [Phycisphaerae bacterium]
MADTPDAADRVLSCHQCGASVYKEHLDNELAGFYAGQLLCVHCMKEKRDATRRTAVSSLPSPAGEGDTDDLAPISLADELEPTEGVGHSSVQLPSGTMGPGYEERPAAQFTRPLNAGGIGATRCRTFHSKLSNEAVTHLDYQINEWLDQNPDIEVKFSTSTVGMWIGKHAEPNLIVTVFY